MDLAKYVKILSGEVDWIGQYGREKLETYLDYHEFLKKLQKVGDTTEEIKQYKEKTDLYRKTCSYAKTIMTTSMTDVVYQKVVDKETALKLQFEATSKDQLFKISSFFVRIQMMVLMS